MKKLISIFTILSFCTLLSACNTIEGAGKDIEKGGEKVQDVSKDVKKKM